MFNFKNFTCFHAQPFLNIDQLDRAYQIVVAKVSYSFEIDPATGLAELFFSPVQSPVVLADDYHNDPATSSTRVESDLVIYKPKLDFVVNALAYAPRGRAARQFTATVRIGNYHKAIAITGERYWQREVVGWSLSEADPIYSLPIHYEHAFGNRVMAQNSEEGVVLHNPVGVGFYSASYLRSQSHKRTFPAHQIYDPARPVLNPTDLQQPEGFGFYSRYFATRVPLAGTTDAEWEANRAPLLPQDFSMSYWNGAHPDLQLVHFKPNHIYDLSFSGLVPDHHAPRQTFYIKLPVETLFVHLYTTGNLSLCRDLQLDTVVVDVEERRVECTYRKAFPEELEIEEVQLRYIARHDRGEYIEKAKQQEAEYFIPLPPSLTSAASA